MEELLSLKWNNHKSTFLHILTILRDKQMYTDATLACEGKFYSVHRLVLSTCSDYFSAMFDRTECKNPIIVLKDIKCVDLEALLDYMYLGEVNVKQSELSSLIKAAECLQVKGLAVPDDEPPSKRNKKSDSNHSPSAKRKRRDEEDHSASLPKQSRDQPSEDRIPNSSAAITDNENEKLPFVKVEALDPDENTDILDSSNDCFNQSNDHQYKEDLSERDHSVGEMSNELPDFIASSSSYTHAFDAPSSQPDLQNWQGDQLANYSGLGFASNQPSDSSQNPLGTVEGRVQSKSIACHECGRVFEGRNCRQNLEHHMLIHTGIRAHACPFCSYKAKLEQALKKHIRTMHLNSPINNVLGQSYKRTDSFNM